MIDYLEAPVPYIIGVTNKINTNHNMDIIQVIIYK